MSSSPDDDSSDTEEINNSVPSKEELLSEIAIDLPKPDDDWTNEDAEYFDYEHYPDDYDFDDGFSVISN